MAPTGRALTKNSQGPILTKPRAGMFRNISSIILASRILWYLARRHRILTLLACSVPIFSWVIWVPRILSDLFCSILQIGRGTWLSNPRTNYPPLLFNNTSKFWDAASFNVTGTPLLSDFPHEAEYSQALGIFFFASTNASFSGGR
jgi:hypothetical protein